MKVAFYEIAPWETEYIKEKLTGLELTFHISAFSDTDLPETDVDVLSTFVTSPVTLKVLEHCSQVKLIATRTTGFDHINLDACKGRGVIISNVPTYGENTVAEFTFALLLALSKKIYASLKRVREQALWSFDGLRGFDLRDKTIGVIGTGHIGSYVVKIAKGFGMEILAYDPFPNEKLAREYSLRYVGLDDLLRNSDVITLHAPYMPATHHMINHNNIGMIKKGAVLLNTSRGGLVETAALITALRNGILSGAALDVLEEEGFLLDETEIIAGGHPNENQMKVALADHELMHMDNVIITPHNAFNTREAILRILDTTVANIQAFASGKPINIVTEK